MGFILMLPLVIVSAIISVPVYCVSFIAGKVKDAAVLGWKGEDIF